MAASVSDQLHWEARAGRVAAGAAALSLVLFVGGTVYGATAVARRQPRTLGDLVPLADDPVQFVLPAVIAGLAFLLLGVVLGYLYKATKYRRPQLPSAAFALLVFGAVAAAVTLIAQRIEFINAAQSLASSGGNLGAPVATQLQGRVSLQVILGLNLGAYLALGLSTLLISVGAMRAGLFSVLFGTVSVPASLSFLLQQGQIGLLFQILFLFWLGALVALFLNRWPGGRGPAWSSGEAIPWPGAAQRNAERERQGAAPEAGEDESEDALAHGADQHDHAPGNGGPPVATRPKRKRGRRR